VKTDSSAVRRQEITPGSDVSEEQHDRACVAAPSEGQSGGPEKPGSIGFGRRSYAGKRRWRGQFRKSGDG
jgi:hypothetical protein